MVGTAVDHAGVIILHVTGDSIIVGPTTRSCLPAMYKVRKLLLSGREDVPICVCRSKISRMSLVWVWATSFWTRRAASPWLTRTSRL